MLGNIDEGGKNGQVSTSVSTKSRIAHYQT